MCWAFQWFDWKKQERLEEMTNNFNNTGPEIAQHKTKRYICWAETRQIFFFFCFRKLGRRHLTISKSLTNNSFHPTFNLTVSSKIAAMVKSDWISSTLTVTNVVKRNQSKIWYMERSTDQSHDSLIFLSTLLSISWTGFLFVSHSLLLFHSTPTLLTS